jgi:hypothetical protein
LPLARPPRQARDLLIVDDRNLQALVDLVGRVRIGRCSPENELFHGG